MHQNKLTYLPDRFLSSCARLRVLNVSNNRLFSLPPPSAFTDQNRIHELYLAANHLQDDALVNFFKKMSWSPFDISAQHCIDWLIWCVSFMYHVGCDHKVSAVEAAQFGLQRPTLCARLVSVCVSFRFPSCFSLNCSLHSRDYWSVENSQCDVLCFGNRFFSALELVEELNLSGNKLALLPDAIGRLRQLQVLKLHSNRLRKLPDFSGCVSLRVRITLLITVLCVVHAYDRSIDWLICMMLIFKTFTV